MKQELCMWLSRVFAVAWPRPSAALVTNYVIGDVQSDEEGGSPLLNALV